MEQLRLVNTPHGPVSYVLERKRVKNLNLRIRRDGTVVLSIPMRCPLAEADRLVQEKSVWILEGQARMRDQAVPLPPMPERGTCRMLLQQALERVYPLVKGLGVAMPELKLRTMRSQWGNCHWRQGYVTLNTALARCPEELRDYVALHELVHFLHHDHGPGFYACMDALMPDWRGRRKALHRYGSALIPEANRKIT